ncbi:RNA polymerase sigma factor SigZ [Halodesulfovibrio sp. MK-HDV]|uniref:RNA polymerase sigma factor SigZ n=1 Tax=Halodesulfovibrio sp. MK-HDV TaxID=2599925 RepID=UPI00137021B6|nr:RNA polymerase sigma factor SigZ [Halodesulfovibrio sp. MK-HDV]KAF1076969.1 ECF RNA polymerase sigma factor SigH [Halodesulfovibrio sp. MK-HDV]
MEQLEAMWLEHQDSLLGFIKKRVGSKETAEDMLHDVFLKFHAHFATITDHTRIRSWLFQVTRNVIIDHYRTRTFTVALPEYLEAESASKEEKVQQALSTCVEKMVLRLPRKYRVAVQLADLEGQPQLDVASLENISLSGAKSRVQRGRKLLRDMMFDCCSFEVDRESQVVDWSPRHKTCKYC